MDPFTMALLTFGTQKIRGKSTKRSFRDAMLIGTMGQLGGMAGVGGITPFGQATAAGNTIQGLGQTSAAQGLRGLFPQFASQAATAPVAAIPAVVPAVTEVVVAVAAMMAAAVAAAVVDPVTKDHMGEGSSQARPVDKLIW